MTLADLGVLEQFEPSLTPPVGSIGFCAPIGTIGRLVAKRQHVTLQNGAGCSHVIIYIGEASIPRARSTDPPNPRVAFTWEARRPRCRMLALTDWERRYVEWYAPVEPFTLEETRILRSIAYFSHDRIEYSKKDIFSFLLFGYPDRRDAKLYCSEGIAELYSVVRDVDLSQLQAPWTVDPRAAYQAVRHPHGGFMHWATQRAGES